MPAAWPELSYDRWHATCDTLHAHLQVLGKLAVALAPPEPQLQHAALRPTARGVETIPLPAPNGSGALVASLDLNVHEAVIEHSDGMGARVPLTPHRSVGAVCRELLAEARRIAGDFAFNPTPQEVGWTVALDEDEEHATYETLQVEDYAAAAAQAALVLAAFRAPYRGRCTPVNSWWGSFDLAVNLFSGESAEPPASDFIMRNAMDAEEVAVGWWPGDARYDKAAFYAYAHPAPAGFSSATLAPAESRWDPALGEFVLDWEDVRDSAEPRATALLFARSAFAHSCAICGWDPALGDSAEGRPAPVS